MRLGPHDIRGAHFDVLACVALLTALESRDLVGQLEAHARGLAAGVDPVSRAAGDQLLRGLGEARSARREWQSLRRSGSGDGTSEPARGGDSAESAAPSLGSGSSAGWTVRKVATEGRVSDEYVRRLCRDGTDLRGHQVGKTWVIDKESAAEWLAKRRRVA